MLNNYEVNDDTLAIIPVDEKVSKVIEYENIILVNKKPTQIIDDSCKFFGSSFLGRHEGTKNLIGINYKSPIVVEETNNIIFFPTSSPRFNNCEWVALNKIKNYSKYNDHSKIVFDNNSELVINISIQVLKNQILRATLLESTLRKRINR